jgi:hypothetical protein
LVRGGVGSDVPLHDLPVPETEGGLGKGRQIPNRIAFLLRCRGKLGHDDLRDLPERKIGRDLQT